MLVAIGKNGGIGNEETGKKGGLQCRQTSTKTAYFPKLGKNGATDKPCGRVVAELA